jgi:hypothetical protein
MGITFAVCDGVITAEMCMAHASSLTSDPDWLLSESRLISDWRSASMDTSVDRAALDKAAAIFGAHQDKLAHLRLAMLAHDGFDQAVTFAGLLNRCGASVIVFNTTITACKWLGVDNDKVNAVLRRMRASGGLVPA